MGEDFIFDFDSYLDELWNRENPKGKAGLKKGGYYDGKYHPYLTDNGDWDIGPGFDLSKQNEDFVKKAYSTGFTKDELNNIVRTRTYSASKDIINKYKEIGGDPKNLTQKVHNGMLDMYWELGKNGLINGYKNFWEAAKNVDYAGMQKESRTTFWDKNQKKQRPNISRWNFRKSEYFQDPDALKYIERPNPYSVRPIQETSQPEYNGIIQDNPIPYRPTIGRFSDTMRAHGGPLSDQQYYSIMERVAEENNPIWNQDRVKEGGRPLSVDEEYLRILNDNSYNYRGFYEENPEAAANASTHWPDRYKTVWHPTFSTESIYSGKKSQYNPEGVLGGQWNGDEYVPAWGQRLPKYSDGGPINTPKSWNDLSLTEKAEMMKVAVQNGITTLPEIRQKYNEFARGGYIPSEEAKQRISKWEGKAMTGAKDPITGKWGKNNSFENEAAKFYSVLPESIREQVLSNQDLADNLYSYSYNVGAGNFRKRVVPALERYYSGEGSIRDVENSMWASNDSKLRGLQRRRAEEKEGVRNALLGNMGAVPSTNQEPFEFIPSNPQAFFNPYLYQQTDIIPEPLVYKEEEVSPYSKEELEKQDRRQRLNALSMVLGMSNPYPTENNSMLNAIGLLTGSSYAKGGRIHIKPENRGKFTRLKERTGHSASWFKAHGTPAQKKMATFALNAAKWKHGYGGNLYDGITESTQQMQTGKDYWAQLANKPTWLDTFITPVNGGQLPEVVVKPTNDESWLFSLGKYARNGRKPLADSHARKVVANYLSRFDNESAKDYNARISRLADALDIRGVQFIKNNVESGKLKNRAHYDTKSNTAYIDDMHDIFAEVSHPWQDAKGNNFMYDEVKKGNYNPDIDPRGGTRYAYPDTFEGETHGFFEPALTEWVETGKIGRSLPLLNEDLSNEKIVPKDNIEVLDSAASWNKQAIDKRVIANPHQLPLTKRIQYSIWDYPLLNKKKALGGNLYNGTSQSTQQMDNGKVLVTNSYGDNYYIDPRQVNSTEWNLTTPEVSVTANPDDVARGRAERWFRDFGTESNDATSVASGRRQNSHLDEWGIEGAVKAAAWAKDHPVLNNVGLGLSTIPLAVAATPAVVGGGELAATALANPYVDAGITSAFAGHGLNHAINEGIDGWGDAAVTALELAPLGRLAKPLWNVGKEGLQYVAKAADNTARYVSPSYDLYRTIGETTPRIGNRFISSDINNAGTYYTLFNQFGEPIGDGLIGDLEGTSRKMVEWVGSKNKAHKVSEDIYNTAVQDALASGNEGVESGIALLSPQKTLATTSKFPYKVIGEHEGHDVRLLTGTTLRPYPQRVSGRHWYEIKPRKEFEIKYNELTGDFEEVPIDNTVADNIPTIEWANATKTPQITAENAASITPEQWTAAQDAAIARGDMAEAQRLSDLHFKVKAPEANVPDQFHGTHYDDLGNQILLNKGSEQGTNGIGFYTSSSEPYARRYGSNVFKFKVNAKTEDLAQGRFAYLSENRMNELKARGYKGTIDTTSGPMLGAGNNAVEYTFFNPNIYKLRDAVTYDNNGVRIPLGERHNFNINDIRYGLIPFLGLGAAGTLYGKQE